MPLNAHLQSSTTSTTSTTSSIETHNHTSINAPSVDIANTHRQPIASKSLEGKPTASNTTDIKSIERKALCIGIVINILMVLAGYAVFMITGLKAMFLDASFTVISVVSSIIAVILSRKSGRTSERFPRGMFALEPMYAIAKAMFTLSLLIFAVLDASSVAVEWLLYGEGEPIKAGPVLIYEIITVLMCAGLLVWYKHYDARIRGASTMVQAEVNSTFIDGAISLGIGIAALAIVLLPQSAAFAWIHYTGDFWITLVIALCAIKEPVGVLKAAFIELVGGVHTDSDVQQLVEAYALQHIPEQTEFEQVLVFKTGMNYRIDVQLRAVGAHLDVAHMLACKRALEHELTRQLGLVDVDFAFD